MATLSYYLGCRCQLLTYNFLFVLGFCTTFLIVSMGGGDLNSKKSWHPSTIKNQERVWKAEQAAAEEKKRISELQRERAQERDHAELNDMAKRAADSSSDSRLNWMYDKPDKKIQDEDYLLGKSIEKNYGNSDKVEDIMIPAVARRVVGSSMLASTGDAQVDLARKIREDPLLLVKERERAARAALLNNPLHRKRLADLLRKEQESRKEKPKKNKNKSKDLDNVLAEKLSALSGEKGVDIAMLLASGDSSSDSDDSSDHKSEKKKKSHKVEKRKKKSKKTKSKDKCDFTYEGTKINDDKDERYNHKSIEQYQYDGEAKSRKRRENSDSSDHDSTRKQRKYSEKKLRESEMAISSRRDRHQHSSGESFEKGQFKDQSGKYRKKTDNNYDQHKEKERRRQRSPYDKKKDTEKRSKGLSDEEKAARLAEMAAAGVDREIQRGRRVAEQRRAEVAADATHRTVRSSASRIEARALPDSLESRIHSNRHYIQRDKQHMNQHFARR